MAKEEWFVFTEDSMASRRASGEPHPAEVKLGRVEVA